jgi:hypothetical protein
LAALPETICWTGEDHVQGADGPAGSLQASERILMSARTIKRIFIVGFIDLAYRVFLRSFVRRQVGR